MKCPVEKSAAQSGGDRRVVHSSGLRKSYGGSPQEVAELLPMCTLPDEPGAEGASQASLPTAEAGMSQSLDLNHASGLHFSFNVCISCFVCPAMSGP